jgi:uncharacterized protein
MDIREQLYRLIFLALSIFYLPITYATADGPDFFQSKVGVQQIFVYEYPDHQAKLIHTYHAPIRGIRNLGCEGGPSYEEWSKLNDAQKEKAKAKIWCKISYQSVNGWVQNQSLSEDNTALQPTFDCKKATREVEIAICRDQNLIKLDNQLNDVFQQALHKAGSIDDRPKKAVKELKVTQRGWIKGRNDCWKAQKSIMECIESNYLDRMTYLQAKWLLVSPSKTERYFCEDSRAEFYVASIPTKPLASVVVEYGDKRAIFIANNKQEKKRFDGEFGAYIEFHDQKATLLWDQFKPPLTCKRQN